MRLLLLFIIVLMILGVNSVIAGIGSGASFAILAFQMAYLAMLFALLYIIWKKRLSNAK
ncbi:MAG: hypothetical protein AAGC88_06655 [Bacteroidota bacterium]